MMTMALSVAALVGAAAVFGLIRARGAAVSYLALAGVVVVCAAWVPVLAVYLRVLPHGYVYEVVTIALGGTGVAAILVTVALGLNITRILRVAAR